MFGRPTPDVPGPGQESVWDYPRPPAIDAGDELVIVEFADTVIAESRRALRVLETSHPPVYYLPRDDVRTDVLRPTARRTHCEYKGVASYADLVVGDLRVPEACWWYDEPVRGYEALTGAIAFYPQSVDRCLVDGEVVTMVEGDFYGSWVTSRVVGPFKGGPTTLGW
jgi:uncharacterized protein (DUF427 family)